MGLACAVPRRQGRLVYSIILFSSGLQPAIQSRRGTAEWGPMPCCGLDCVTTETRPLDRRGQLGEFGLVCVSNTVTTETHTVAPASWASGNTHLQHRALAKLAERAQLSWFRCKTQGHTFATLATLGPCFAAFLLKAAPPLEAGGSARLQSMPTYAEHNES